MSAFRSFLMCFVVGVLAPVGVMAAANYRIDPYQVFRPSNVGFSQNLQRFSVPGVIRHYQFDSFMVGNSMGAYFTPEMFPRDRFRNLVMFAGTLEEAALVANQALSTKDIKIVYWAIGMQTLTGSVAPDFPYCLYGSRWSRFPYCYLFNFGVFLDALDVTFPILSGIGASEWRPFDTWKSFRFDPRPPDQIACEASKRPADAFILDDAEIKSPSLGALGQERVQTFHKMVLPLVRSHPDTRFVFFFPPFYKVDFAFRAHDDPSWLHYYAGVKRLVLQEPNVSLYDFQTAPWAGEPERFMDNQHSTPDTAARQAEAMATGAYRVTVENLDANNQATLAAIRSGLAQAERSRVECQGG